MPDPSTGQHVDKAARTIGGKHDGASVVPIPPTRIKAIRKRVAKWVRVFSERFGLPAKSVQQWEQGARRPDAASSLLLEIIDSNPDVVAAAAKRRERAA
jgi:putative transcriptional regulator